MASDGQVMWSYAIENEKSLSLGAKSRAIYLALLVTCYVNLCTFYNFYNTWSHNWKISTFVWSLKFHQSLIFYDSLYIYKSYWAQSKRKTRVLATNKIMVLENFIHFVLNFKIHKLTYKGIIMLKDSEKFVILYSIRYKFNFNKIISLYS